MLTSFRRVAKSKVGTGIMASFFIMILASFAMSDISNFGSGKLGFGMGSSTLAQIGNLEVSDREMGEAMQRRLQQVRQQNPSADYATIAGDFDQLLDSLIDEKAMLAFADKYGFNLSKRLIDGEIAQIPQTKGLNGEFSDQAYRAFLAQQRLSDAQVREIIASGILQQMMQTPIVANTRVPVGVATPYAAMLLEQRSGAVATIPVDLFKAGLNPTDADLQRFYTANRNRYIIPEQRVIRIARIGASQVAGVAPSDQEITAYYNANKATYGTRETRTIAQAVVPDQATANGIAARAKGGATLAAAAAPAGANAAVTTLSDQTRDAYSSVAGDKAAAAAFGAASGTVVGPIQSDFGWVVAKVEGVKTSGGKTLEQARPEIVAKLTADKRKEAVEDVVDTVQDAVDNGSNFVEAAARAKLAVEQTPLIVANGTSRADASFHAAPELAPAIKTGFDIAPNDQPEIVTLANNAGYALVSPAEVVAAAPAPLASIRDRVSSDWVLEQATNRARTLANSITAKANAGGALADALKAAGRPLPPVQAFSLRRLQIAMANGPVPDAMKAVFTTAQGKAQMIANPKARAFQIVKVDKVVPGNALSQPALISRMQKELQDAVAQDYSSEFLQAIRQTIKVRRNESAIAAAKQRMVSNGG